MRRPRREDLGAVANGARQTWRSIVRVMALVWATSRKLTLALAGATLLQSITPAAQVWLAGRLIDEVVAGVQSGGSDQHVRAIVVLAALQLVLLLGSSFLQTAGNISQQLLQERLAIHIQLQIMRHAATLDLADFENAAYYDQLQQAQRESAQRPVQMVSGVFGLGRSIVTFATMVALLLGLSPWVAAAALIAPIPAFISGSRYGWWGFQQMRRQSPVLRVMSYLTTLMTTDEYAKEVKLFTAGDYFIDRYQRTAAGYYEETRQLLVRRYLAGFGWGSLTTLASSGTFLYVALLAVRGQVTLGALTVFTQAAAQVQGAFQESSAASRPSTSTVSTYRPSTSCWSGSQGSMPLSTRHRSAAPSSRESSSATSAIAIPVVTRWRWRTSPSPSSRVRPSPWSDATAPASRRW